MTGKTARSLSSRETQALNNKMRGSQPMDKAKKDRKKNIKEWTDTNAWSSGRQANECWDQDESIGTRYIGRMRERIKKKRKSGSVEAYGRWTARVMNSCCSYPVGRANDRDQPHAHAQELRKFVFLRSHRQKIPS